MKVLAISLSLRTDWLALVLVSLSLMTDWLAKILRRSCVDLSFHFPQEDWSVDCRSCVDRAVG